MFRILSTLMLSAIFIFSSLASAEQYTAAVLYSKDGKGDKAFNDAASEGVTLAKKNLAVNILEVEPRNLSDAQDQVVKIAKDNIPLVIAIGFPYIDIIKDLSTRFPKTHFAMIDGVLNAPNVANYVFREHEGSFLAGYIAAKTSKSDHLGFVGGMPIPPVQRFLAGYKQGIKLAKSNAKIIIEYVSEHDTTAWNNPTKAKSIARDQFSKGVDIIYAVAGGSGTGVLEAAKEAKKYAIGVDINQNSFAPGYVIASTLKRVDQAVLRAISDQKSGTFKSGTYELGIKDLGVDLALDEYSKNLIKPGILKDIEDLKKKIAAGALTVQKE